MTSSRIHTQRYDVITYFRRMMNSGISSKSTIFKMADEQSKSVSFTFAKKKSTKKLQNTAKSVLGTDHGLRDEEEEKDFIKSAEGNDLKRYLVKVLTPVYLLSKKFR